MLYDLKKDPEENINVAGEKEYQDKVKELDALLNAGWEKLKP